METKRNWFIVFDTTFLFCLLHISLLLLRKSVRAVLIMASACICPYSHFETHLQRPPRAPSRKLEQSSFLFLSGCYIYRCFYVCTLLKYTEKSSRETGFYKNKQGGLCLQTLCDNCTQNVLGSIINTFVCLSPFMIMVAFY